jgi:hypothetical protein
MWQNDKYYYSKHILKEIAYRYDAFYEGIEGNYNNDIVNPWSLAEFAADFTMAFNKIGRGKWSGEINDIPVNYRRMFGKLQSTVLSDILGENDGHSERAYMWMSSILNGKSIPGERFRYGKRY